MLLLKHFIADLVIFTIFSHLADLQNDIETNSFNKIIYFHFHNNENKIQLATFTKKIILLAPILINLPKAKIAKHDRRQIHRM